MPGSPKKSKPKDIFKRCYEYTKPQEYRSLGLYPYFTAFCGYVENTPMVLLDGRQVLMFGSNNYLGLTTHPKIKEASIEAIRRYGTGCSGSRMLNGTLDIHLKLEEELADFTGKEATLLFSTGFMTNGCLSSLLGRDEFAILDKSVHASIIYGTMATFSKNHRRFKHNDMQDLANVLESLPPDRGKLVVVDGVFSMEGDTAPLPEITRLCKRHGVRLYVDEAHGIGVLGENGIGTAEHYGALKDTDILMATFSKSFASTGGFIASERPVIEYLKHHSLPFIYSASMPAPSVAAARAALQVIQSEPERRRQLIDNARSIRNGLDRLGFDLFPAETITPVIPVIIDDEVLLCQFFHALLAAGIYTNPIFRPAAEKCMIRVSCMATHTGSQIDQLLNTMAELGRQFGLIE
jgi:8-amino-7-oxononanoate synthase